MQAKEIIFNNIEILNNIFQYVDFHQQLNLTRVCRAFQDVIVNYTWKLKYKELEVIRTFSECILTNRIKNDCWELQVLETTRILLYYNDLEEFFILNANNVQILKFCLTEHAFVLFKTFDFKYKLPNLTFLTFAGVVITADSLNMLPNFFPQLEKLALINCVTSDGLYIRFGKDIKVENIQNIKTLKYLEIKDTCCTYSFIIKILTKLKLLEVKCVQEVSDGDYGDIGLLKEDKKVIFACQVLKIERLPCLTILGKCLNHFQNLAKLKIGNATKDNDFFAKLSNSCKNLACLELETCTLTNIAWPKTLNELVLIYCRGLTCRDLKYILCNLKLKAFTSTETEYAGTMTNDSTASNTLEYLNIDVPQIAKLFELEEFDGFKKLSFLKYQQRTTNNQFVFKHLSKQCPDLRKLFINDDETVFIEDLYKLELLERLEIKYATYSLSNLLQILKHSSLTHLVIPYFTPTLGTFKFDEYMDIRTNLFLIHISMDMLDFQDFWLDLLNSNPKLRLIFWSLRLADAHSKLQTIITDPKFPDRLKTINICGFNIDCQHLRDEFHFTLGILNLYQHRSCPLNEFYIIL